MSLISIADLLKIILKKEGKDVSELLIYFQYKRKTRDNKKNENLDRPSVDFTLDSTLVEDINKNILKTYRADFKYFSIEDTIEHISGGKSLETVYPWLREKEKQLSLPRLNAILPVNRPIFDWQKLKDALKTFVYASLQDRKTDIKQLTRDLSELKYLTSLPKAQKQSQVEQVVVFVDFASDMLRPLFNDFIDLRELLREYFGKAYTKIVAIKRGGILALLDKHAREKKLSFLLGFSKVIIISDFGLYKENNQDLHNWLQFAGVLNSYSCTAIALLAVPSKYIDAKLINAFKCFSLPDSQMLVRAPISSLEQRQAVIAKDKELVKQILMLLQSSNYIHPQLLRTIRLLLNSNELNKYNLATEIYTWYHEDIERNPSSIRLKTEVLKEYHNNTSKSKYRLKEELKQAIRQTYLYYHGKNYSEDLMRELVAFDFLYGNPKDELADYVISQNRNLARRLYFDNNDKRRYFVTNVLNRYVGNEMQGSDYDFIPVMQGLTRANPNEDMNDCEVILYQFVDMLVLRIELLAGRVISYEEPEGVLLFKAKTRAQQIRFIENEHNNHVIDCSKNISMLVADNLKTLEIQLPEQTVLIKNIQKPSWAKAIAMTKQGVEIKTNEQSLYRLASIKTDKLEIPASWYTSRDIEETKPKWAKSIGRDENGIFADLEVKNVVQRFRWIEAGEFMMGSPEDEADRYDDEKQHRVRLTEGYWLADTACSQELWLAVTNKDPSHFKGGKLPVESVFWEEAKEFTNKLNRLMSTDSFDLPTEAQWEYACRAGTKTAYAYGEKADRKLMNFNGNISKTIEVKSLYKNDRGLYQMHGNVYEWCKDWFAEYEVNQEIMENPEGPKSGERRVLRGGSWLLSARDCRSAFRFSFQPVRRDDDCGFRLFSGHQVIKESQ